MGYGTRDTNPDYDTIEEREALCHMHDIMIDVSKSSWTDNSRVYHPYVCRLSMRANLGRGPFVTVEGLGMAEWWEGINALLTHKT